MSNYDTLSQESRPEAVRNQNHTNHTSSSLPPGAGAGVAIGSEGVRGKAVTTKGTPVPVHRALAARVDTSSDTDNDDDNDDDGAHDDCGDYNNDSDGGECGDKATAYDDDDSVDVMVVKPLTIGPFSSPPHSRPLPQGCVSESDGAPGQGLGQVIDLTMDSPPPENLTGPQNDLTGPRKNLTGPQNDLTGNLTGSPDSPAVVIKRSGLPLGGSGVNQQHARRFIVVDDDEDDEEEEVEAECCGCGVVEGGDCGAADDGEFVISDPYPTDYIPLER